MVVSDGTENPEDSKSCSHTLKVFLGERRKNNDYIMWLSSVHVAMVFWNRAVGSSMDGTIISSDLCPASVEQICAASHEFGLGKLSRDRKRAIFQVKT